ncbi:hypothetical protein VKT23_014106 [Stygiomarasmius scandens]|uniref:Uncharacterized protein n=1 Tax=Marasmiellus scandens TaxID=2682957 RepID=A0ABR1J1T0_9AGAR
MAMTFADFAAQDKHNGGEKDSSESKGEVILLSCRNKESADGTSMTQLCKQAHSSLDQLVMDILHNLRESAVNL